MSRMGKLPYRARTGLAQLGLGWAITGYSEVLYARVKPLGSHCMREIHTAGSHARCSSGGVFKGRHAGFTYARLPSSIHKFCSVTSPFWSVEISLVTYQDFGLLPGFMTIGHSSEAQDDLSEVKFLAAAERPESLPCFLLSQEESFPPSKY